MWTESSSVNSANLVYICYNFRDIKFFLGGYFFGAPCVLYTLLLWSLASVCLCLCVCHRSCGRNFKSNFMKFCAVVWDRKTKIEFVTGQNPIISSLILPPIFTTHNAFSMERSKHQYARWPIVAVAVNTSCARLSVTMRDVGLTSKGGYKGPHIGNHPLQILRSSDRWRHVT